MPLRVGLLVVATGRYAVYVKPLLADCAARFLPGHERTAFVFSDSVPEPRAGLPVVHVPTPHEPWPAPTLKRFHFMCGAAAQLAATDVLYYLDADTRVVGEVGDEVLPSAAHELVAVHHPGFCGRFERDGLLARIARRLGSPWPKRRWVNEPRRGTYESDPRSTACVAPSEGVAYFQGAFYGGRTAAVLAMAARLRANVDLDLEHGLTAVWHDESHLNRYLIDHPPKVLSPSYAYPERWGLPFVPRILLLDKDHAALRAPPGPSPTNG